MVYSRALQSGVYGSASILLLLSTLKGTAWGRVTRIHPRHSLTFLFMSVIFLLYVVRVSFERLNAVVRRPLSASLIYLPAIFLVRLLSKFLKLSQWFSPLGVLSFIKQRLISNERRKQCFSESIGCRLSC
jgi:hypothetical protein